MDQSPKFIFTSHISYYFPLSSIITEPKVGTYAAIANANADHFMYIYIYKPVILSCSMWPGTCSHPPRRHADLLVVSIANEDSQLQMPN